MKVLFVYSINDVLSPAKPFISLAEMQFGISYISSFLKVSGHETRLLVLSKMFGGKNRAMIDEYVRSFSPELICFTAVATEYPFIADTARYIKSNYPAIFLLAGGPHVSLDAEAVLGDDFDALCIGEGERPTSELISQLENGIKPSGIPNLWFKRGDEIEKNPPRPFLQDLDSLPFPDREMWEGWVYDKPEAEYPVLLGRGCPFRCTYCCNHALKRLAEGPYVRFRSPDNIIKEISSRSEARTNIYLEIETIGADKKWILELCSKLQDFNKTLATPPSYRTNLRITPNLDVDTLFSAFRKSSISCINIGLESGSERVRSEILKRDYSNRDIINAVSVARKYGLKVHFYNLIGIPGEKLSDHKETIRINRECLPDRTYNHIFYPYPGTELYLLCKKDGLLPKTPDTDLERCKAVLDLPGFSKKEIEKSFIWFDYHVFKGHKPLYKIFAKVAISKLRSNSLLHHWYRKLSSSPLFKRMKDILRRSALLCAISILF